jgi:hypothetical protein
MDADTPPDGPSRAASIAAQKPEPPAAADIAAADTRKGGARAKKASRSEVVPVSSGGASGTTNVAEEDEGPSPVPAKAKALSPPPPRLTVGDVLKMPRWAAGTSGVGGLRMLGAEHGAPVEAAMFDCQLQSAWEAGVAAWRASFAS